MQKSQHIHYMIFLQKNYKILFLNNNDSNEFKK